jgi:hypothetical protein
MGLATGDQKGKQINAKINLAQFPWEFSRSYQGAIAQSLVSEASTEKWRVCYRHGFSLMLSNIYTEGVARGFTLPILGCLQEENTKGSYQEIGLHGPS